MLQLSKRLQAVADYVSKGTKVADVGTDHGYIPIYLVENGICEKGFAMDVRKGPLERAENNIERMGLSDRIETRLSDGLVMLRADEADSIVISGMGGCLIARILNDGKEALSNVKELILSPHSDVDVVRHYLHDNGYAIANENMLIDDNKYYTVIRAVKGNEKYDREVFYKYGKILLEQKDKTLYEFLISEKTKYINVSGKLKDNENEAARKRYMEVQSILEYMEEGIAFY